MVHPGTPGKIRTMSFLSDSLKLYGALLLAFLLVCALYFFTFPSLSHLSQIQLSVSSQTRTRPLPDPTTFYDDPKFSYTMGAKVRNWDEKRSQWMAQKPEFSGSGSGSGRIVMLTGSQPNPCENPIGDQLLLRFFKNKVDYCRIHGYDIFYNNLLLDHKMTGYWVKYPVIKATMLAHPEAEWIWWVDSDAIITDMDFNLPLERYKAHNLVVHGWPSAVFGDKSWTGLNAGVFLIRNCQWSMDFLDRWVSFGPSSPDYHKWGLILKSIFTDKLFPDSDDQTALAYMLVKENNKWGDKIYLEGEYYFEGYWIGLVGKLDKVNNRYRQLEKKVRRLARKHAEKDGKNYRAQWEDYLKGEKYVDDSIRRPFITHFTGCQPCNGNHNPMYTGKDCWDGMAKALNFADNQVLRSFGYFHPALYNSSYVEPISFP